MIRTTFALTFVTLLGSFLTHPAIAQRGGQGGVPMAGTMLPEVTVYDEAGNEFSTSTLRGKYSVVVFGCLT
ncbi:MAG: hypothetical protein AB8B91_02605 [Rubripirellula sp.]